MSSYKEFLDEDVTIVAPPTIDKKKMLSSVLQAIGLIGACLATITFVIACMYALYAFVIIPYPLNFGITVAMSIYYICTVCMFGMYGYHVFIAGASEPDDMAIPLMGIIGNIWWFGIGKTIAYLVKENSGNDYGWRYDLFFYSTVVVFMGYCILGVVSLSRCIYREQK